MAKRYWGVNLGQHLTDVQEGAASPATNVEVNVDLAINMSREEVLRALELIRGKILQDVWPPA
jgi:hypothetical protein